jgi:4'-phosphopantetheinyl transferase
MPLLFIRQINKDTFLGFWQLAESPEALRAQLLSFAPADLVLPDFGSATRRQQWLGGRLLAYTLLQQLLPTQMALLVAEQGEKPYFDLPGVHLSISHTRQQVVVILSASALVGIDIETISPKVLRVKDKFLTPAEQHATGGDLNKTLIYWCAKETLYKLYGRKQLLFKEHISTHPFHQPCRGQLTAGIRLPDHQKDYSIHYEVGTDFILTYCLDEPV